MAKELYIPVNGFSKKTSKFYAPVNGFSKEIVKAYCSVNGFSKLFFSAGGLIGVIFENGEFYNVPNGLDISNYHEARYLADLKSYFFYPDTLWVNPYGYNEWELDDKIIKSGIRSAIFIPINRIYDANSIKYICKNKKTSNLGWEVGYTQVKYEYDGSYDAQSYITSINQSSDNWVEYTHNLSQDISIGNPDKIVDYIYLGGFDAGVSDDPFLWTNYIKVDGGRKYYRLATAEDLPTSYIPQPVKFDDVNVIVYQAKSYNGTAIKRYFRVISNTKPVYRITFKHVISNTEYVYYDCGWVSEAVFTVYRSTYPSSPSTAGAWTYNGKTLYVLIPTFADRGLVNLDYSNFCPDNFIVIPPSASSIGWNEIRETGYIVLYGDWSI